MASVITRSCLESLDSEGNRTSLAAELLSTYRVRLCKASSFPIWCNLSATDKDILVVDLKPKDKSSKEDMDCKFDDYGSLMDYKTDEEESEEESPLQFRFMSLASLQSSDPMPDNVVRRYSVGINYFECNPIPIRVAMNLRNRLREEREFFEHSLQDLPLVFVTDNVMGSALLSLQLVKHKNISSFTKFYPHFTNEVEGTLQKLTSRFNGLEKRIKATAVYQIKSNTVSGTWVKKAKIANMRIKLKWSGDVNERSYLIPPSPSASATISFYPGWKDQRITLYEKTLELEQILCMAQFLMMDIPMKWPNPSEDSKKVEQSVANLIEKSKSIERSSDSATRFLDFTEYLWEILKHCDSYQSLVSALKVVYSSLKSCQINAILHPDNKSTIARCIRDSLSGDLNLPRLEAATPIQLLLEIAVESFQRNMMHTFVTEQLATSEKELVVWLPPLSAAIEKKALGLLPLHISLQTALEIKKLLHFNAHHISTMTRAVLATFCSKTASNVLEIPFETDVSFVDIRSEIIANARPWLWINESSYYLDGNITAQTVTQFTKEINFKHLHDLVRPIETEDKNAKEIYSCFLSTTTYDAAELI